MTLMAVEGHWNAAGTAMDAPGSDISILAPPGTQPLSPNQARRPTVGGRQ
jgi:hypothetical protein